MLLTVVALILVALIFDYINGFHDAANSIATVVSTRVLSPRAAVVWAAVFNFIAFKVFETKVAGSIAKGVDPTVVSVAEAHGKTPAQVLIRWSIQLGNVVIPRSSSPERVKSNLEVFDFELTDDEMASLNGLDDGTRFRPDPETYTGT